VRSNVAGQNPDGVETLQQYAPPVSKTVQNLERGRAGIANEHVATRRSQYHPFRRKGKIKHHHTRGITPSQEGRTDDSANRVPQPRVIHAANGDDRLRR
jgi:hypothetical protein